MAHVLAKLTGASLDVVRLQLEKDAAQHALDGMFLQHVWQNAEEPAEVLFLFRVNDLEHCRQLSQERHARARRDNPGMPLPQMTFLDETS